MAAVSGGMGRTLVIALALALAACAPAAEPSTTTTSSGPPGTTSSTTEAPPTTGGDPSDAWPAPRRSHGLVALDDGMLLLVAGRTNAGTARTYLADSWLFDTEDGTWTAAGSLPTPRAQIALTGTEATRAILMGGYVGDRFTYPGTWEFTATGAGSWERLTGAGVLTPRAGSVAAYDRDSGLVVLFGGAEQPTVAELPTNETWVLTDSRWVEVTPDLSPRPKSEGHPTLFELAMVYDTESDLMVLLIGGDETWVYDTDANRWEERTPPGLEADFMVAAAYDQRLDRVVMYGGAPTEASDETWLYDTDADTWERVETVTDPGRVGDHAMAWDPVTQRTYLFGGGEDLLPLDGVGDVSAELWAFDGTDWSRIGP